MKEAIKLFYSNYFNFKGRTNKQNYNSAMWFILLITAVAGILLVIGKSRAVAEAIVYVYSAIFFASLCPFVALNVRRAHDMGKSGAFVLVWGLFFLIDILLTWACAQVVVGMNLTGNNAVLIVSFGVVITSALIIMKIFFSKEPDGDNWYGRPGEEDSGNKKWQYEASDNISNSENEKKKVCWSCGSIISFDAVHCPNCGSKQNS